jgi:hypothetical protein
MVVEPKGRSYERELNAKLFQELVASAGVSVVA